MKKLFILFLLCSIFALGCNKSDEVNSDEVNIEENNFIGEALDTGMKQLNSGDFEAALATYTKAIEQVKDNASLYSDRGRVKKDLGDFDGAIEDINKALELSEEGWIYTERADVYDRKGENELALQDFKKALSLDPSMNWVKDILKDSETQPEGN